MHVIIILGADEMQTILERSLLWQKMKISAGANEHDQRFGSRRGYFLAKVLDLHLEKVKSLIFLVFLAHAVAELWDRKGII